LSEVKLGAPDGIRHPSRTAALSGRMDRRPMPPHLACIGLGVFAL
jgi:hypothetical protein